MVTDPAETGKRIADIIARILSPIIIALMLYLLYRAFSKKDIGKPAKILSWIIGIFFLLLGSLAFLLFVVAVIIYSKDPNLSIWGLVVFFIISILPIIGGILLILTAKGKLWPKYHSYTDTAELKQGATKSQAQIFDDKTQKNAEKWIWYFIGFIIIDFIINRIIKFTCESKPITEKITCNLPGLYITLILFGIFSFIYAYLIMKYKSFKLLKVMKTFSDKEARNWGIFSIILGIISILVGIYLLFM